MCVLKIARTGGATIAVVLQTRGLTTRPQADLTVPVVSQPAWELEKLPLLEETMTRSATRDWIDESPLQMRSQTLFFKCIFFLNVFRTLDGKIKRNIIVTFPHTQSTRAECRALHFTTVIGVRK